MALKLFAPEEYWKLTPEAKKEICNGCGPKSLWFLVPDTLYGLNITEACNIHDYMYLVGEGDQGKIDADEVFMNNMVRLIEYGTKYKLMKWLRYKRAFKYFTAVSIFGGPTYWKNKNKETEYKEVK